MVVRPASSASPLAPTTTAEQNLVTAGQRHINVMWESTQRNIALVVTASVMLICGYLVVWGAEQLKLAAFTFSTSMALMVIQNYFTRTNHTRTGGVGANEAGR